MSPLPPRALVVYESMFGNTKRIAEAIGWGLASRYDVALLEVSHAPAAPEGYQLLVVGGPIHGFTMSREASRQGARKDAFEKGVPIVSPGLGVREWLAALPPGREKGQAAAFDTGFKLGWFVVGSAARAEASSLRSHGYALVAPPEHFLVKGFDGPLREGEVERAERWGAAVAAASLAPPPATPKADLPAVAHLRLLS